jgi:hypothetical protein
MVVCNHLKCGSMKLTPGQVQSLLGLSRATYRHWKDALPPLEGRNGHSQCFSLGDLFAMALIKAMTDDAGLRVGALHAISATLFAQCGNQSWAGLERSSLVVELPLVRVEFISESQVPQFNGIGILVPCSPIVAELRERLLMSQEEPEQGNLRLAPTIVASDARGRRVS